MTAEVLTLSLKKMDLLNTVKVSTEQRGWKITPFATYLVVWKYWHSVGTASALTLRPAKQRMSLKLKTQMGLEPGNNLNKKASGWMLPFFHCFEKFCFDLKARKLVFFLEACNNEMPFYEITLPFFMTSALFVLTALAYFLFSFMFNTKITKNNQTEFAKLVCTCLTTCVLFFNYDANH